MVNAAHLFASSPPADPPTHTTGKFRVFGRVFIPIGNDPNADYFFDAASSAKPTFIVTCQ